MRLDAQVSEKRAQTLQTQLKLEVKRFEEESRSIKPVCQAYVKEKGVEARSSNRRNLYKYYPLAQQGAFKRTELLRQRNRVEQLESEVAQARASTRSTGTIVKNGTGILREISDLERQLVEVKILRQRNIVITC